MNSKPSLRRATNVEIRQMTMTRSSTDSAASTRRNRALVWMAACALALSTALAHARPVDCESMPGNLRLALNSSVTGTMTYPEGGADSQFLRFRSDLLAEWNAYRADIALDLQGVHTEDDLGQGLGAATSYTDRTYYRIQPLRTDLGDAFDADWTGELDRAFVSGPVLGGHASVGRQGVGLGRGVLFSAVDVFAPFSALDVDREWRRGVDAARWEMRLDNTWSTEAIGVFGPSWNDSAALARLRGFTGRFDAEIIAGKRAEDLMLGADGSVTLAGAEIHTDLALFDITSGTNAFGDGLPDWVFQSVLGGSYTFNVGNGLTVLVEHYYNGFGEEDVEDSYRLAATHGGFRERLARGDMRTLGDHAFACQVSYPVSIDCSLALRWIANLRDGSGIVTPFLSWQLGQRTTLLFSLYLPHGDDTIRNGLPRSEYGHTPITAFAQIRIYD